ncbi:MAG: ATP-dependent DNA helicase [Flammeovirgaceae bacterium]|jgi:DNA helicase-2/ATP-dependent DNA helicase PcrA|nr:ATP-dependent DNA helicase [Flammeovirgaceae bacterium]|tara:strand:- start:7855 stop:10074 length:2220 start_codon:yes stop_codon:yes gene_type:complete
MKYLEDLNSSQKEAVLHPKGPCLVIAGAGSGKTRVLTYRIAHLIKQGIDPFSILALTFTNKAAKEMKNRIEGIVGTEARSLWMGTFHSIFARILRTEGYKIGYPPNFVIYDTQDSKNLIKAIVKEQNLDPKLYKENFVFNRISNAKNRLISPLEYKNNPILQEEDSSSLRPMIGEIYKIYSERCFKSQAMDFDDLLFNTNTLFSEHIDILNKYQQLFQHVLIDEFQDTNYCQYLITKRLASVSRNIFVVGDDAQSIYAFRGAEIRNILKFEDDFDDLKTIKLEQNYRSTKTIVNAANSVIEKNKSKISKEVWTDNEDGELISVKKSFSDNEEGKIVSNLIFEEKNRNQLTNSNFAVLYRTNSQSRSIEEALRRIGLKYKVFGGVSFYQRKEVKDLIAYLRFSINQNDEQSFRRIINYPRRGIGQTSVDKIITISNKENISLWDVIQRSSELLNSRINNLLTPFKDLIISFSNFSKNNDAYTTASHIASNSGLLKELWDDRSIEGISRYENVQELLNSIKEFLDNDDNKNKKLEDFLQEISLMTDQDKEDDSNEEYISLMTIHMAKGLEFSVVFIVGVEEDLFPSQMMISSREDLEEERRLFYVAITRAMKKLYLTYSSTRYRYGMLKDCEKSRFIKEISPAYLDFDNFNTNRSLVSNVLKEKKRNLSPIKKVSTNNSSSIKSSNIDDLIEGVNVKHEIFGIGTIKKVDNHSNQKKAIVNFKNVGEKTLLLNFAKLKVIK